MISKGMEIKNKLDNIFKILNKKIPNHWGFEIVYRPFDFGIFGKDGYTIYFWDKINTNIRFGINKEKPFTKKKFYF